MTTSVALITGASSGIGHALALEYARRRHAVVVMARRADRLAELAAQVKAGGGEALAVAGDVGQDGDMERVVAQARARFGRLDVVVANAGISVAAPFERLTLDDFRKVFEVNVFGVIRTAMASLDALKESRGAFAAIGSVNGFVGLPGSSPYVSSKFAVRGLCDVLYHDLAAHHVSVTHIAPGFIDSEIRQVGNDGVYRPDRRDPIPSWLVMPAPAAARQIAQAIADREREAVITFHGKAAASLARHAPDFVAATLRLAGSRVLRDKR